MTHNYPFCLISIGNHDFGSFLDLASSVSHLAGSCGSGVELAVFLGSLGFPNTASVILERFFMIFVAISTNLG